MLPQPFVTTAQSKAENIRIALDLAGEWDFLQKDSASPSALVTGVVVARSEFIDENPDAIHAFLDHYRNSAEYVNRNIPESAKLIEGYDITPAAIAEKAIPACNITFISGDELKEKLSGYLTSLFDQNPASVGGALLEDDFYYLP